MHLIAQEGLPLDCKKVLNSIHQGANWKMGAKKCIIFESRCSFRVLSRCFVHYLKLKIKLLTKFCKSGASQIRIFAPKVKNCVPKEKKIVLKSKLDHSQILRIVLKKHFTAKKLHRKASQNMEKYWLVSRSPSMI